MTGWDRLSAELDAWGESGLVATFWWRDDDADRPGPQLSRLLETAAQTETPVALAVIPASAENGFAEMIPAVPGVSILQHGYAHQNHAPPRAKKAELGTFRPFPVILGEIAAGWQRLEAIFRHSPVPLLPVMVPPWNRIAPQLERMLPEIGFSGISTWGPRDRAPRVARLARVNCHVDIVDWHGSRGLAEDGLLLAATVEHLRARRDGAADLAEPTGLLTHHKVHDEPCWRFIETLIARLNTHPATRWVSAEEAFGFAGERAA